MPWWQYHNRPKNSAFHDLTTILPAPKNLRSLLGLGLKFIPSTNKKTTKNDLRDSLIRFKKDVFCASYFNPNFLNNTSNNNNDNNMNEPNKDMTFYIRSNWTPDNQFIADEIHEKYNNFYMGISNLFSSFRPRWEHDNLLSHQRKALKQLQQSNEHLIVQCDKNLGPAIIETTIYIQRALQDHLHNQQVYRQLSMREAFNQMKSIKQSILVFIESNTNNLSDDEKRFLQYHMSKCKNPFPTFYMTMKVHKNPWKTRPIVSCSGSLLQPLGQWIDRKLQSIVKKLPSFIKNSSDLIMDLSTMTLPENATLFTADAISMYTNIDTDTALSEINRFLHDNPALVEDLNIDCLMEALTIVMRNNIFTFGDTYWHQLSGTAMGTPPAPCYATLFYAIKEQNLLENYSNNLLYYKRYIDDVFAIWDNYDPPEDYIPWLMFKSDMNFAGLKWEVSERKTEVDFLDVTIRINNNKITTTMYEKALNLHLYLPPHSAHPAGVLKGIIIGHINRIFNLCNHRGDKKNKIKEFYHQLLARGHRKKQLTPIFQHAIRRQEYRALPSNSINDTSNQNDNESTFLHLQYYPLDPPSQKIQSIWRQSFYPAQQHPPIASDNRRRLIVAYKRGHNIGNLLSYRNLNKTTSYKVSDFL